VIKIYSSHWMTDYWKRGTRNIGIHSYCSLANDYNDEEELTATESRETDKFEIKVIFSRVFLIGKPE
jgi:hypothetical protein